MSKITYKGKIIEPYEGFYWDTREDFFHGTPGGGSLGAVNAITPWRF